LKKVVIMMESVAAPEILLVDRLRRELLRLAKHEDDNAFAERAKVPYWEPCPVSVLARHAAARLLREDAARLGGDAA
jgi:hypothetical protein